jgi:hypothetical protein
VTAPSEQWIVRELRRATDVMPLPPESRWIPQRRSASQGWLITAVIAATIFLIAVLGAISALRGPPRVVPATQPEASSVQDAEWARARAALPPDVVVLRPTWIPDAYRASAACQPSFSSSPRPQYEVRYTSRLPDGTCAALDFTAVVGVRDYTGFPDQLSDMGTIDVRSAHVGVRAGTMSEYGPAHWQRCLWWNESAATYEVCGVDVDLVDLVGVVRALEPVR